MRLAVLGATGRTGVPLVQQAVAAGHEVAALVRSPDKRGTLPGDIEVVEGDARDEDALARLVTGADAVIDVTGPVKGGPDDLRRTVTPLLVTAMRAADVPHLVMLTGAGVRVEGDEPGLADRAIRWIMQRTVPAVLEDAAAAVDIARSSDREVTVVRAPRLTDGHRGSYDVVAHVGQQSSTKLGRGDLAAFLLDVAATRSHVGAAPVVSW